MTTAFIVISTAESLNNLVDDIERCRPQNSEIETCIGTGKLIQEENGLFYHYTCGADNTKTKQEGYRLKDLITNQIAEFRLKANLKDAVLQLFLLENPISQTNIEKAEMVFSELCEVKQYHDNYQLTRVVFSYDLDFPSDITNKIDKSYFKSLKTSQLESVKNGETTHILYIDNQDRNGASIVSTKKEHDLLMPRMLCDFMMLYSSDNSAYNVRNAAHQAETQMFSIGYAECMYYYKDIKSYYELSYQKDILEHCLSCSNNNVEDLDYENNPLGLIQRKELLSKRYNDVAFDQDINDFPNSVDKDIDDIIVSLRSYIEKFKEANSSEDTYMEHDSHEHGADVANYTDSLTQNQVEIKEEFPDFIDRAKIFELWSFNQGDDEDVLNTCRDAELQYNKIIEVVKSDKFREYLYQSLVSQEEMLPETDIELSHKKGCNFFARIFHRGNNESRIMSRKEVNLSGEYEEIKKKIINITKKQNEKAKYRSFCDYIKQIENEIKQLNNQIEDLKLTKHSKSYYSMIDLNKLKMYYDRNRQKNIDMVINSWCKKKNGTFNDLKHVSEKECDENLKSYKYIDWENKFEFVNDVSDAIIAELHSMAVPFVNASVIRDIHENLTTSICYHDNRNPNLQLSNSLDYTIQYSSHIESKCCVFQVLQIDRMLLEGLTDLFDN